MLTVQDCVFHHEQLIGLSASNYPPTSRLLLTRFDESRNMVGTSRLCGDHKLLLCFVCQSTVNIINEGKIVVSRALFRVLFKLLCTSSSRSGWVGRDTWFRRNVWGRWVRLIGIIFYCLDNFMQNV